MTKTHFLVLLIACCFLITGCEKESIIDDSSRLTTSNFEIANIYTTGEIVIKYEDTLTEDQKQEIRDQFGIVNYKKCTCADPTLELWIFDLDPSGNIVNGGTLEGVVESSKGTSGVEGSQMNDIIRHDGQKLNSTFGIPDINNATSLISPTNDGVTIAILDTGIDYNYFGFNTPFLYNSQLNPDSCQENGMTDYFGWDFVENDNNPFDYHSHGTKATSMIFNKLTEQNINFQILPVKVFDENGDARYFDILCGFKYATNNSDVKVINMSFGWYNTSYTLLNQFIEETQDDVVIITSAGNDKNDNDATPHYPSSYETQNIMSIASWNGETYNPRLSKFSNYGVQSVDIAALGENIPFYINPNEYIFLSGTSYAAAYTTAVAGQLYTTGMTPLEHIQSIHFNTIVHNNLMDIKYRSYLYY